MPVKARAKLHEFTLTLAGLKELTPKVADTMYQLFDDGTAGSCNGEVSIDFHREASSFQKAVQSAVRDIRKGGFRVARVETEESRLVEQINATLT
ncbi:MAG TPA: hypothetical protein VGZ25_05130 [Gemmataceae bacterium]|nr:hypothetical protein [Gemmataceae bacterium]